MSAQVATGEAPAPAKRLSRSSSPTAFAGVVEGLLLAGLVVFVLNNYFIRAHSDPMNYLTSARRVFEEFRVSRWPVGYPLFLWLALHVTGPYYIFFINLPVLAALLAVMSRLVRGAAAETEPAAPAALLGAGSLALVLAYDPRMLIYLTNPYRDPLSLLLNAMAALWLLRYVRDPRHPARLVALSGLCTGLSYSIREPCILMIIPLATFALYAAWHDRRIPFWKSAFLFGALTLLGALPFLVQTYLRTGQVLIPGEAAVAGRLPGLHWDGFPATFQLAIEDLWTKAGPVGTIFLLGGIAWAFRRGSGALRFLFLPAVLVNFLFYSFYWTFVRRYFFVVTLFAAPLAAFGLFKTAEAVLRLAARPRRAVPVFAALTLGLAGLAGWRMFSIPPSESRFRIRDAVALTAAIDRVVPPGSAIFCPRNLCEILDYFTQADSYPLAALIGDEPRNASLDLRNGVERLQKKGARSFVMEVRAGGRSDPDTAMARRLFNMERVEVLDTSLFLLEDLVGAPEVTLWRLGRWARNETRQVVPPFEGDQAILRIDAGVLWDASSARRHGRLYLNRKEIDDHVDNGANYYVVRKKNFTRPYAVVLKSDQPVASDLAPVFLPPDQPIVLDFGAGFNPSHDALLSPDFEFQPLTESGARLADEGTITLPNLWADEVVLCAELSARATRSGEGHVLLEVRTGQDRVASDAIPKDRRFHSLVAVLPRSGKRESIPLMLTVDDADAPDGRKSGVEIDHIRLTPIRPGSSLDIDLGEEGDGLFIVTGLYRAELAKGRHTARWTADRAGLRLFLKPPSGDLHLNIACVDAERPAGAPKPDLKAAFNGNALELAERRDPESGLVYYEGRIPADAVVDFRNVLDLTCTPWVPCEHSETDDARELGVLLDRVTVSPAEGP